MELLTRGLTSVDLVTVTMEGTCYQCAFPVQDPKFAKYRKNVTPLMYAAWKGYLQCVKDLIADMNKADDYRDAPLMWAAKTGQAECLLELIKSGADVNSALFPACRSGFPSCVDVLLKAGAHMNMSIANKSTSLMEAASWDNPECVQLLINAGADVNFKESGNSALKYAAFLREPQMCGEVTISRSRRQHGRIDTTGCSVQLNCRM